MNEEHRNAMISALESAFAQVGIDLYSGAQRLSRFLENQRPVIEAACSRESLAAHLESAGEQDEAKVTMLVALISAFPALAGQFVSTVVQEKAATMPRGTVGRPLLLTPEMRREVVERVGRLFTLGTTLGAAQFRVAQQLGLSKRTVQAAWQQRRQLAEQPFQSMQDVWKLLVECCK